MFEERKFPAFKRTNSYRLRFKFRKIERMYIHAETYKYLKIHCESRSFNENNNAWARSLVRQSDGLLIHRPGVQIPSGPLISFSKLF
jgi:hypothetical protein